MASDATRQDKKVAIVTGGASGIGASIAAALLADGFEVCVLDISIPDNPEPASLAECQMIACDISDPEAVASAIEAIGSASHRVDVLVNNVGVSGPTAPVEDIDIQAWQQTIDTNLNAMFYVSKAVIPLMKAQRGGVIVNMASNAGLFGCPNRSPYAASKWAMIGLTKTWAMELGKFNIRVNALCPASVSGPRIEGVIERDAAVRGVTAEAVREVYERQSSLRSFTKVEDIASMVCYLAGPGGTSISGQAIALDGHTETLANWLDP